MTQLIYKGYSTNLEWDSDQEIYVGTVAPYNILVVSGTTTAEAFEDFKLVVDSYLLEKFN